MARLTLKNGFTLVELVTIVALISIILVFAIPRFQNTILTDDLRKVSQWIILSVPSIKERAQSEQKEYTLNIDIDAGKMWMTDDVMTEEEAEAAVETAYIVPSGIYITDVEFPIEGRITSGQAEIHFYKKGYSDKALIHITDDEDRQRSFLIEPFLRHVRMVENYIGFGS